MIVLGLHFETHDSGAAIVRDGEIVCAVNEERLSRKKHDKEAPVRALRCCLELAGVGAEDVDVVAISGHRPVQAWARYLTWEVHRARGRFGATFPVRRSPWKLLGLRRRRRVRAKRAATMAALEGFRGELVHYPHEHLHVSGAYWTAAMDDPVVVVAEGSGWDRTCTVAVRERDRWRDVAHTLWPHSPGEFYDCVTRLLGFRAPWHAGKITGLAAYGDPDVCMDLVRPLLRHEDLKLRLDPSVFRWTRFYEAHGEPPPEWRGFTREDLAAAFQRRLEEVMVDLVAEAVRRTGKRQVALAGGTFANVKLNQRILALPEVEEIFVHPGMSDVGIALGGALEAYADRDPGFRPLRLDHVYLGPSYGEKEIVEALAAAGLAYEHHPDGIEDVVADRLAEGALVARFRGHLEYGPRALGNRSILYKPTDPSVNDWLNERLHRTEFMPFAPSARLENRHRLFHGTEGSEYAAEFMTMAYDCTEYACRETPAMVHVDATARPHLVRREANPSYDRLLEAFEERTGLPCLINTSFNVHEEPIVCSPRDAAAALLESRLDYLAIESFLVPLPESLRVARPGESRP